MKSAYGINIPRTLEEVCDPQRIALRVYDMQVGILSPMLICITSLFTIATFRNVAPLQLDQEFPQIHSGVPMRRTRSVNRGSLRIGSHTGSSL